MTRHLEVERTFDVEPDRPLPDLAGVGDLSAPEEVRLEATYVDTEALTLARHGITLRRRTGGADEGWHLKLRAVGDERVEVHRPLGPADGAVPPELLAEVRAFVRDRPLRPVAVLRTTRVERHLRDAAGAHLAVIADDTVHAERLLDGATSTWREIEVELVAGDPALLSAVAEVLLADGLRMAGSASKLARTLGDPRPGPMTELARGTAAAVVVGYLRAQRDELLDRDREARAGDPEGVHKMRVAARRLRSALSTYLPLFDGTVTEPVREELRWLGTRLAGARDAHVQRERLLASLEEQADDLLPTPARLRIDADLAARQIAALTEAREALGSDRYYRLLDAVDRLADQPPLTDLARRDAAEVLPDLVGEAVRRVRRRARAVTPDLPPAERDLRLHETRKAAKRARYAAEVAGPVGGKRAAKLAARMESVQEVLGEHQDSATAQRLLRDLATRAAGIDEAFALGVLQAEEAARGRAARGRFPRVLDKAMRPKLRRWAR